MATLSATAEIGGKERSWRVTTLRISLGTRAVWNATFALYLLQQPGQALGPLMAVFVRYAYVDALLALLVAGAQLAASPNRMLWLSPAIDALTRGALVAIVAIGPGVLDVPLTAVLYVGLLATFAVVDGGLDLLEGFSLERDADYRHRWVALSVSGTAAMAAGIVMFVAYPGVALMRAILIILGVAHAVAAGAVCADHEAHDSRSHTGNDDGHSRHRWHART